MAQATVDLSRSDRGALFVADEEAIAAGWATGDPYPGMLRLLDEGQAVREGAFDELLGLPPQFAETLRDRKHYTALSFDAVNQAFMDGETFTNHIYDYLSKPFGAEAEPTAIASCAAGTPSVNAASLPL